MDEIVKAIKELFFQYRSIEADRVEKLPQSGSDRVYFRIYSGSETVIATYNKHIKENQTFIYFSKHFASKNLPVPQVYAVSEDEEIYLQQDLGTESLLDHLEKKGHSEEMYDLYKQTLKELARIQISGSEGLDYNHCLTAKAFGKQAMLSDLLYFKYYFLDTLKTPYDKQALLDEFDLLSNYLEKTGDKYFLFRDFQSRNVIVNNNKVFFIDYQGGMKGALQYDVASILWQAKANLPAEWKASLLEDYIKEVEQLLAININKKEFISQYNGFVLIRLLQVLGAYGFRGLFERKAHFLSSIPLALKNLQFFIENNNVDIATPELKKVLELVASEEIIKKFTTVKADENTPLVIKICSFSYKKQLPQDETSNGGGFLFDMRGILNPGRFPEYKYLTGRDKEVKDFLEQQTRMTEFLNSAFNTVDIAVEDYVERKFTNLMVGFGCTGGQHRSVYAADALARHLKNKYGVKVEVSHMVQDAKNWINEPVAAG